MKNTFLTIGRARLTENADTETLLTSLKKFPELILVHLFAHEPVVLLFIEVPHLHDFDDVYGRICHAPGIADCTYRHLSPALQSQFPATYLPPKWLS